MREELLSEAEEFLKKLESIKNNAKKTQNILISVSGVDKHDTYNIKS